MTLTFLSVVSLLLDFQTSFCGQHINFLAIEIADNNKMKLKRQFNHCVFAIIRLIRASESIFDFLRQGMAVASPSDVLL